MARRPNSLRFCLFCLFDCRLFSNAVSPRMHQPPPKMSSIKHRSDRVERLWGIDVLLGQM